jgi:hypothetical protein
MTLTEHILDKRLPAALVAGILAVAMPALAAEVEVPTIQPVVVEDHLIPEDSIYDGMASFAPGYDRALLASFKDVFEEDVIVRAIIEPSFETEFAVGLKKDGETYKVIYQEVSEQLWQYSVLDMMKRGEITSATSDGKSTTADEIAKLEKSLPANSKDVKVNRCERAVDAPLGKEIVAVWKEMLLQSRYSAQSSIVVDGTTFHFSGVFDYQRMAAQTWSPDERTKTGMLANLAYHMKAFCTGYTRSGGLSRLVDDLSARLDAEQKK